MRNLPILLAMLLPTTLAWSMPLPCGTQLMMAAGGTRDRPAADSFVDSDTYPIRVHYRYGAEDLAEVTLEAAELSWLMEVEQWGWEAPAAEGWVIHADLEADTAAERWALSLVSLDGAREEVLEQVIGTIENGEAHVSTEIRPDVETVIAVVAQVGDGDLDPTQDDWSGDDAQIQIWVEGHEGDDDDATGDDDDATGDDDDDASAGDDDGGGCSCSHRPDESAPVAAWLALLGAAAWRLAYRR